MTDDEVRDIIRATVQRYSSAGSAGAEMLIRIAERESGLTPTAVGDREIARKVWLRDQEKIRAEGNPWWADGERWAGSFGLYQLMAPYMVRYWDPRADPYVLFDPVVSTIVAMRLANRAWELGARDFVSARIIWAYGPDGLRRHPPGSEQWQRRYEDKWSVVSGERNPPLPRFAGVGAPGTPAFALQSGGARPTLSIALAAVAALVLWWRSR